MVVTYFSFSLCNLATSASRWSKEVSETAPRDTENADAQRLLGFAPVSSGRQSTTG